MAGDWLPPVIAVLAADIAAYTAGLTEAEARMGAFVESQTTALAELDARMAAMGAGGAEAGMGAAAGAGVDTEAAAAATAAVQADNDRLLASFDQVGSASAQMAAEVEASYGAMAEKTAALSQGMVAAEEEAAAANAAVGDAMVASSAKSGEAAAGISKAGGLMSQAMFGAKLGLAAAAVESVKMAGDFQSSTERLALSAGEDQRNIDMVRQGMLNMAGQVGYSAEQLATAMYKVESGGQHGADGLKVLQAAAEGAKTENADLTTVADALTSAMVDYKIPADQAATTTSKLVAATSQGKMTFQELAGSLSSILPVASANHVALNDVLGDLASMTVHGVSAQQATQNLADAIRHMAAPTQMQAKELAALGMNATEVSKDLGEKGLSGTINDISQRIQSQMGPDGMVVVNLTNALKGLPPAVQATGQAVLNGTESWKDWNAATKGLPEIQKAQAASFATLANSMHGIGTEAKTGAQVYQTYSGALRQAMGDATGMNVALMIGGQNAVVTANAIKVVSGATAEAGNHVKGWSEIQQTFNQKWAEFKDGLGAAAIEVGTTLLPVLGGLLGVLGGLFNFLAAHKVLLVGIAAVVGTALVPAIIAGTAAVWAFTVALLANPLTWVALAVGVLAMAVYELIEHWRGVADFFKGVWGKITEAWNEFWSAFANPFATVGKSVSTFKAIFLELGKTFYWILHPIEAVKAVWDSFMGGFENPAATLSDSLGVIDKLFLSLGQSARRGLDDIGHALAGLWDAVTHPFVVTFDFVKTLLTMSPTQWGELIGRGAGRLARAGLDLVESIGRGIKAGWNDVYAFFTVTVPNFFTQTVPQLAERAGTAMLNAGKNLMHALWNGLVAAKNDVVTFFTVTLPQFFTQTVPQFAARVGTDLLNAGKTIITGLWHGLVVGWNAVAGFFTALPGEVLKFFTSAPSWLYNTGADILHGLWNGIASVFGSIWDGISGFIGGFIHGFEQGFGIASPSTVMMRIGGDIIRGLWNGVTNLWGQFMGMIGGLPNQVINMFSGAASWLVAAGYNILVGLYNGMIQMWNKVTSFVGSIGSWIAANKGPLDYDATLLTPHGTAIISGLINGMKAQMPALTAHLDDVTRTISTLNGNVNVGVGAGGVGGPSLALSTGGVGGQGVTVQLTVQGSVWTTDELARELQEKLLRYGINNTSNGTNYSFA